MKTFVSQKTKDGKVYTLYRESKLVTKEDSTPPKLYIETDGEILEIKNIKEWQSL